MAMRHRIVVVRLDVLFIDSLDRTDRWNGILWLWHYSCIHRDIHLPRRSLPTLRGFGTVSKFVREIIIRGSIPLIRSTNVRNLRLSLGYHTAGVLDTCYGSFPVSFLRLW